MSIPRNLSEYSEHFHPDLGVSAGRNLYTYVQGIGGAVLDTQYCMLCPIKDRPKLEDSFYYCNLCNILYPAHFGAHQLCLECDVCTGSTCRHTYLHEAGKCKGCTAPNIPGNHQYCYICKVCLPFSVDHSHAGK